MEEFANLPWRISEASVLDIGTNFISEETIAESYTFLDNFVPPPHTEDKSKAKTPKPKTNKKLKRAHKSYLDHIQHKQCLEALQLLESNRPLNSFRKEEQNLINTYNKLKIVIVKENAEYLKFVEFKWNQKYHVRTIKHGIKKLNDHIMAKRQLKFDLVKSYPKFYADNSMIPLVKNQNIEMIHEGCLLELGVVAKLDLPNIERSDNFNFHPKQTWMVPTLEPNSDEILATTKLSVSNDIHAEFLAKQTACNVVISSNSLKTIIDNFGPDFGASWDIPIVVKEHIVNGRKFNVVYVDKTLPKKNITSTEQHLLNNFTSRKILVKRLLCKQIAHSFETPNVILENVNAQKNIINEFNSPKSDSSKSTISSTPKNNLASLKSPKTNAATPKTNECSTPKQQKLNSSEIKSPVFDTSSILTRSAAKKLNDTISGTDLTEEESNESSDLVKRLTEDSRTETNDGDEQMPEHSRTETNDGDEQMPEDSRTETNDGDEQMPDIRQKRFVIPKKTFIRHDNVNYRLWKLKSQDEENILLKNSAEKKEIKLLVRSKIDAYQVENGKFVSTNLTPKLEYQSEYGATMSTKSELLRQWTTLYFRPFSNLLRVRTSPQNNRYLKFENINLNKITYECMKHYNFNPKENLGVLFNVLSNLTDLNPGNYILHHEPKHGTFAAILESVSENSANSVNFHDLYKDVECIETNIPSKWIPVDTSFILPSHIKNGIMPGLFPPPNFGKSSIKRMFL